VVDDLGRLGRVWREVDYEATDFETVVTELLEGQYKNPIGIFSFNTAEGWSRDDSADIAAKLKRRCDLQLREVPVYLQDFVARHVADRSHLTAGGPMKCTLCEDTFWVCGNHPTRPWEGLHACPLWRRRRRPARSAIRASTVPNHG
jgi:hypothetical protein